MVALRIGDFPLIDTRVALRRVIARARKIHCDKVLRRTRHSACKWHGDCYICVHEATTGAALHA